MAHGGRKHGTAGNGVLNGSQTASFQRVRNPVSAKAGGTNTRGSRPKATTGGSTTFNERTGMAGKPQVKINPFKPVPGLNPLDSQYMLESGQNLADYSGKLADINLRSEQLKPNYDIGARGIQQGYDTSMYGSNAALASRGLLSSGGAQNASISRNAARDAATSRLEQQYGNVARTGLTNELGALSTQYGATGTGGLADVGARLGAAGRYAEANPFGTLAKPIMPTQASFANYKGPKGFYKSSSSPSGYRFVNKAGVFTNALKAPAKGRGLIANPIRGY